MITKGCVGNKKSAVPHIRTRRKCTPRYHPNFRLKANTLIGDNGALPYRVSSHSVSPICSKGKCTTQRLCTTRSYVALSVIIYRLSWRTLSSHSV